LKSYASSHRAEARILEVGLPVRQVSIAKTLRQKALNLAAKQFLARVSEKRLCLGVNKDNFAGFIDDDHRVRSRLEKIPKRL
jgi:hypothetical protein